MNKYLRAVSVNYIFFAINTVSFLIITSAAIRVMGEEFYGLWSILNAILLFSGIGMLGMGMVVNKFTSETGANSVKPESALTAGVIILLPMAGLIALTLLVTREWIATRLGIAINLQQQFSQAIVFTALSIFPLFLARVPHGYLLSQLKNGLARTVETAVNIAYWIGAVVIAALTKNLAWMALWGFLVQITGLAILFMIVAPMFNWKWSLETSAIRRMLKFSAFSFIESVGIAIFQQFDRILVGLILGPAAAGVYSVGTSVGLRLTMVTGQVTEVMIPYASLNESLGHREKLYGNFRKLVNYVSISLAALSSLLIIWMPEILSLWISQIYAQKYAYVFRVFVLCYGLFTLAHPGRQTLMGIAKANYVAITYLVSSTIMIITVYFLSGRFELLGAAWANGVMILLILFNIFTYGILNDRTNWAHIISDMAPGILIPVCTFLLVIQIDMPVVQFFASLVILMMLAVVFLKKFPEFNQVAGKFSSRLLHKRSANE
jgi:O-antigen/teichoic acid export membrane protein